MLEVIIRNLSEYGCRIEFFGRAPLTQRVFINEATIPANFLGEVIWQADGAAGLRIIGSKGDGQC